MDLPGLLKVAQKMAGIKGRLRIHDLRHTLGLRLRKDLRDGGRSRMDLIALLKKAQKMAGRDPRGAAFRGPITRLSVGRWPSNQASKQVKKQVTSGRSGHVGLRGKPPVPEGVT